MKLAPPGAWNRWNGIIAALVVAISLALVLGPPGELSSVVPPDPPGEKRPAPPPDQDDLRRALDMALVAQRQRRAAPEAEEDPTITEHLASLEEDLEPDEAAARLSALGNLFRQKEGDYETAAGYYEILIERYPEWEGILGAYRELISCYEALGKPTEVRLLYRRMLDVFPEESEGHVAAREALKR